MEGIKIGREYRISSSGHRWDLPYAGEIGTLIEVKNKEYTFRFEKKGKIERASDVGYCNYFLGDFEEVDKFNTMEGLHGYTKLIKLYRKKGIVSGG